MIAKQPGSLVLVEAALAGHYDRNYSRSHPVLEMKMEGVEKKIPMPKMKPLRILSVNHALIFYRLWPIVPTMPFLRCYVFTAALDIAQGCFAKLASIDGLSYYFSVGLIAYCLLGTSVFD